MRLIEWEVAEDGYEEQIVIPKQKRVNPTLVGWPLPEIIKPACHASPPSCQARSFVSESVKDRQSEADKARAGRSIYQQKYRKC